MEERWTIAQIFDRALLSPIQIYVGVALLLLAVNSQAAAQQGITDDRIIFGQSAAFDGPASSLGTDYRNGLLAAFNEVNRAGGIDGRRLELISYNDGYEPEQAIENTNRLIKDDQVFALVGQVGTPTAQSAQPIAQKNNIPFVGAFTGVSFLRNPALRNVVNFRASYDQEAEALIDYLTGDLGLNKIGVLYQDDTFGRAGLTGINLALRRRNLQPAADGTYMRNTTAVKRALLSIRKSDPDAVVIVGAYKPTAAFIQTALSIGVDPVFAALSFVGGSALAAELDAIDQSVFVSQVVPLFEDIPLATRFKTALDNYSPDTAANFIAFEGYIVGRLLITALQKIGPIPTREKFIELFNKDTRFDLDGLELTYGPDDNQGSDEVYLTEIGKDGSFTAVERKNSE